MSDGLIVESPAVQAPVSKAALPERVARGLRASRDRTGGERDAEVIRELAVDGLQALAALRSETRHAIWGGLTVLRLLYSQQRQRGAGGYAHVLKSDIERLEAAYAALADVDALTTRDCQQSRPSSSSESSPGEAAEASDG